MFKAGIRIPHAHQALVVGPLFFLGQALIAGHVHQIDEHGVLVCKRHLVKFLHIVQYISPVTEIVLTLRFRLFEQRQLNVNEMHEVKSEN